MGKLAAILPRMVRIQLEPAPVVAGCTFKCSSVAAWRLGVVVRNAARPYHRRTRYTYLCQRHALEETYMEVMKHDDKGARAGTQG